jgi:NTP pyrophosphatase (non-canonical NTP hydrolase)
MSKFLQEVQAEADRAIKKHGNYNSLHEAFGVLLEEVDEFWEEVRKKRAKRSPKNIRTELKQIAAVCLKTAEKFGVPAKKKR